MAKTYKIKPALVIIDMQNCFVSPVGSFAKLGYEIKKYQKTIPVIRDVYQKAKLLKIPIFFSKAVREKSGIDAIYKTHKIIPKIRRERIEKKHICIRGTWDADIIDELKPDNSDFIVYKRRDSIFQDTEFSMWLKSLKINTLIFTGVDTSICIESSLRDGFNEGWDIILLSDATASLKDNFHSTTIEETKENFGLVFKSKEFFKNLKKEKDGQFSVTI